MAAATWDKLPALEGRANPCACCPPILPMFPAERVIAVGFGDAHVSRDGEPVYREPQSLPQECDACDGTGTVEGGSKYLLTTCEACGGNGVAGPTVIYWDGAQAERVAAADPDHDWQIVLFGPLHGEVYQRHGPGEWMLVEKNQGFA